ncbi:MAG: 50S rRNA methyltransferase, partial [Chlamydiia bacterium]|nr:50S rRNA methyltransferase [Chlamydiia bacterium]
APMRETLAAGLLMLADYNDEPMIDPCCGSGTLLIEAAWMKQKRPPGCLREHWGFQGLPGFKREEWEAVKAELDARHVPDVKLGFLGIDCDKRMIESAKENLKAAGLERGISLIKSEFLDAPVRAESTFLMTNPPYGRRLGEEKELEPLYAEIGDFIKHKVAKPGRAYVYTGSLHLAKRVGLRTKRRLKVDNGGAEGRLLEFEVFE